MSFFTIISFFPFVMLLMALLKQLPLYRRAVCLSQTFPQELFRFFQATVTEIPHSVGRHHFHLRRYRAVVIPARVYSSSAGWNSVYDVQETRSYIKRGCWRCFIRFPSSSSSVALLLVLVFGNGFTTG
ncbi:MAG: hypothetical protein ACLUFV_03045 [Acutalibacteraceae bacterium]